MSNPMHPAPSKEFYSIKDDAPKMRDPSGTGMIGRSVGVQNFSENADGHPVVYYRAKDGQEFFLTIDIHALPGQPTLAYVTCPHCENHLTIKQANKAIDYDSNAPDSSIKIPGWNNIDILAKLSEAGPPVTSMGGRLSIEPFRCSWEEKPELRREFGFGVCGWSVAIDNNVARNI